MRVNATSTRRSTMSNYIVTISTRDKWNADGSPIRDTVAEFDDLEQAIAYQDLHGGSVTRTEDGKSMAPDGTWV
jgi:hypothetical protein